MKNNKNFIILFIFLCISKVSYSNEINFEASNLKFFKEKNLITADKGRAFTFDGDLEIQADKFKYFRNKKILNTMGNGTALINSEKININFDRGFINYDNQKIIVEGNVLIKDLKYNLKIKTNSINYDYKNKQINSDNKTNIFDEYNNKYVVENFIYDLKTNILKTSDLEVFSIDGNSYKSSLAFININSKKIIGKDLYLTLENHTLDKNNQPRLKGNSFVNDDKEISITKGLFSTCKKRDGCPPWEMKAKKVTYDKSNETIYYDNAVLKIYDRPVMYFPKFFHPGPNVNRRSGFLIPGIKNSSNDTFLKIPFYLLISENKDATFSPRFYSSDKALIQTEYRQINSNSDHIFDLGLLFESNNSFKNHLFYDYNKSLNSRNFNNIQTNLKIQRTNNDTYLKSNKIEASNLSNYDTLENNLGINLFSKDLSLSLNTTVYEDLNKEKNSDKFEYIYPKINLSKKININKMPGDLSLNSQLLVRNFNTNIYEQKIINDLIFKSYPRMTNIGFSNNYEFLIKNLNYDSKNSLNLKNKKTAYASGIFQYNASIPMIKDNENYKKILTPKFSLKMSPTHTKNSSNEDVRVDNNNIFSIDRYSNNNTVEGGHSLTYGSEYSFVNKYQSKEILNIQFANNLRLEENNKLPNNNQINQKTSNFFSVVSYNPTNFIKTKYNMAIKNNLSDISYENFTTEFRVNNFVTNFDFLNDNTSLNSYSYLSNKSVYNFDDFNSLSFSTRENKTSNLTEYYNFMYQYKNDCLAASVEYNKDFYNDRDIKPEESIFFKLSIIPFGQSSSPNLLQ
jgi:LPS-assembly protein